MGLTRHPNRRRRVHRESTRERETTRISANQREPRTHVAKGKLGNRPSGRDSPVIPDKDEVRGSSPRGPTQTSSGIVHLPLISFADSLKRDESTPSRRPAPGHRARLLWGRGLRLRWSDHPGDHLLDLPGHHHLDRADHDRADPDDRTGRCVRPSRARRPGVSRSRRVRHEGLGTDRGQSGQWSRGRSAARRAAGPPRGHRG